MKNEIFKNEDIFNMNDHMIAIEQLKKLGTFWIGHDISLEGKTIIQPLGLTMGINIIVNKKDFPEIDINRGSLGALNWSTRSCLAQSGLEVRFHRSNLSEKMLKEINEGKDVAIPIDIQNLINRSIEIEGSVMRFFWVDDNKRLRGEDLHNVINSKELVIEGEEGKDWTFGGVDFEDDIKGMNTFSESQLKDVCIKILLKEKFYIPESKEILRVNSKKDLPGILKEIPGNLKERFIIGETVKVKLAENIIGVLNTGVYDGGQRQSFSPLIDGGFENVIRTETIDGLRYIEMFIYRK